MQKCAEYNVLELKHKQCLFTYWIFQLSDYVTKLNGLIAVQSEGVILVETKNEHC